MRHSPTSGRRLAAGAASLALVAVHGAAPAAAADVTITGELDPLSDPSALVAIISNPECTGGYGVVDVLYDVVPFVALTSGPHEIAEVLPDTTATIAVYVIEGEVDPAELATGCVAAANNTTLELTADLTRGVRYDLVVIDDTIAQGGGAWTIEIESDLAVALEGANLAIALAADDPGPHAAGDTVGFTATVTNGGVDQADAVEVVLALPAGFDPASIGAVAADGGYMCTPDLALGTITCTAASQAAGDVATITFEAALLDTAGPGTYTVTGEVATEPADLIPEDDVATADVVIPAPQAPATTTTAPPPPAAPPVVAQPTFTG